ncbi:hypothetical protein [Sphingomonas aracearum]|uniref:Uncharacterized protein n=1 Tax=Sphingomonas aracearum TaxID=2283317 RepID=A0A369VUC7_9SPHN|nr:hypothetical protein [Sphingomonas aracearum]RDE04800.1 hypothetical protein DVW87_14580 [Sphingomonas aracearum]
MAKVVAQEQAVVAGEIAQVRRVRAGGVTKTKVEKFLAELARTCNVTASCQKVGLGTTAIYAHRRKSPAFASAWEEAIREGYGRLELMLLESAMASYEPAEEGDAGSGAGTGARPKVSEQSILRLLQLHRQQVAALRAADGARAEAGAEAAHQAEWGSARAELEARLLAMHERLADDEG